MTVAGQDDLFVLHARPLRDTAELDHTARFADDIWPLAPEAGGECFRHHFR